MRRIVAYVMMVLPVALLAAHAGNNPFIRTNLHLGPAAVMSRLALHQQAYDAFQQGLTEISADLPCAGLPRTTNRSAQQHAPTNAVGLSSTSSIPLVEAPMTRVSLVAEEEDEEEDGDEEGGDKDEGEGEGEGEEEESGGGWDRVWDAPKLG